MSTALRAQLLSAIATGVALGCNTETPRPTQPPTQASSPAAPVTASASAPATAATAPVSATVPVPESAPLPIATAKPPAGGSCHGSAKRETYCLAKGAAPPKMIPNPVIDYAPNGCAAVSSVLDSCNGVEAVLSGPTLRGKECCYEICKGMIPPCGRLLLDGDDRPVVAEVTATRDWSSPQGSTMPRAAREAWLRDAQLEHASVAAFARFSLELLAIGAPASFVEDAHRAALDEIEHARLCFTLGSAPDAPQGPGALTLDSLPTRTRVEEVVRAAADECCCGETFAAAIARHALLECTDVAARAALERIAADEARHAALGFRFVAWAIQHHGAIARPAAAEGLSRGMRRVAEASSPSASLEAYGRLSSRAIRVLAREVVETILAPLCATLLDLPVDARTRADLLRGLALQA